MDSVAKRSSENIRSEEICYITSERGAPINSILHQKVMAAVQRRQSTCWSGPVGLTAL